ncbi:MAG: helix-turn-helix domain-containing protein [Turicibacter sp.]
MTQKCGECQIMMEVKAMTLKSYCQKSNLNTERLTMAVCPSCQRVMLEGRDATKFQTLIQLFEQPEPVRWNEDWVGRHKSDVLNLQEVASLLRVSHQTIYNMIKDSRLKGYKIGREWRFLREDIIAHIPLQSPMSVDSKSAHYFGEREQNR